MNGWVVLTLATDRPRLHDARQPDRHIAHREEVDAEPSDNPSIPQDPGRLQLLPLERRAGRKPSCGNRHRENT